MSSELIEKSRKCGLKQIKMSQKHHKFTIIHKKHREASRTAEIAAARAGSSGKHFGYVEK